MIPPEGKNAFRAWRKTTKSAEDVGDEEKELVVGGGECLTSNENNGGIAERVAVLRCWLGVRKQAFKHEISPSTSKSYNIIACMNDCERTQINRTCLYSKLEFRL
jgi:hypothetical protein